MLTFASPRSPLAPHCCDKRHTPNTTPDQLLEALEQRQVLAAGSTLDTAMVVQLPSDPRPYGFVQARFETGDTAQLYKLTTSQRVDAGFQIIGGTAIGVFSNMKGDLNVELLDAQGQLIAASRKAGGGSDYVGLDLQPGTYYMRVVAAGPLSAAVDYFCAFVQMASRNRVGIITATGPYVPPASNPPAPPAAPVNNPPPAPPPAPPAPPAPPPAPPAPPLPPPAQPPVGPTLSNPSLSDLARAISGGSLNRNSLTLQRTLSGAQSSTIYKVNLARTGTADFTFTATGGRLGVQIVDSNGNVLQSRVINAGSTWTATQALSGSRIYIRYVQMDTTTTTARGVISAIR